VATHKRQMYALAIGVVAGFAVWGGLSPWLLLVLLVCPVSMFLMMRAMSATREGPEGGARLPARRPRPHERRERS
jgi:hypothetical protein